MRRRTYTLGTAVTCFFLLAESGVCSEPEYSAQSLVACADLIVLGTLKEITTDSAVAQIVPQRFKKTVKTLEVEKVLYGHAELKRVLFVPSGIGGCEVDAGESGLWFLSDWKNCGIIVRDGWPLPEMGSGVYRPDQCFTIGSRQCLKTKSELRAQLTTIEKHIAARLEHDLVVVEWRTAVARDNLSRLRHGTSSTVRDTAQSSLLGTWQVTTSASAGETMELRSMKDKPVRPKASAKTQGGSKLHTWTFTLDGLVLTRHGDAAGHTYLYKHHGRGILKMRQLCTFDRFHEGRYEVDDGILRLQFPLPARQKKTADAVRNGE